MTLFLSVPASSRAIWGYKAGKCLFARLKGARMDHDNFEWWYSEGEAPDEEWDEPAPRDVSSDEDEAGNDAAVEPDAASDAAEPLDL